MGVTISVDLIVHKSKVLDLSNIHCIKLNKQEDVYAASSLVHRGYVNKRGRVSVDRESRDRKYAAKMTMKDYRTVI